jgi:hypothetical protein
MLPIHIIKYCSYKLANVGFPKQTELTVKAKPDEVSVLIPITAFLSSPARTTLVAYLYVLQV